MSYLNISFLLIMIGIWATTEVQCHDQTITVKKVTKLGTVEQVAGAEVKAQGVDTTLWTPELRVTTCKKMNAQDQVIRAVQVWYQHKKNKLSNETPGGTFVYTVESTNSSSSSGCLTVIGFKCHAAADGSYPFIVVYRDAYEGHEYVAYVPADKNFD